MRIIRILYILRKGHRGTLFCQILTKKKNPKHCCPYQNSTQLDKFWLLPGSNLHIFSRKLLSTDSLIHQRSHLPYAYSISKQFLLLIRSCVSSEAIILLPTELNGWTGLSLQLHFWKACRESMMRESDKKDWLKTSHYYFPEIPISLISLYTIQPRQHRKKKKKNQPVRTAGGRGGTGESGWWNKIHVEEESQDWEVEENRKGSQVYLLDLTTGFLLSVLHKRKTLYEARDLRKRVERFCLEQLSAV